ncbi:MAG: ABC transporter ATP-binding protein [Thermodesulfobacteriota bacterium]
METSHLPLLSVDDLSTGYSKKIVLEGVSFYVKERERVAIVGRNGAGKSTLLLTLLGVVKAWRGHIAYLGKDWSHFSAGERVRSGMALVPQGGRVFANLMVRENLELGAYVVEDPKAVASSMELVYETFPVLRKRAAQEAGTMSGGERQMLAIGRAMMSQPKLLMLDEPSLGLAPLVVKELMDKIYGLSTALETTILIVEQNVRAAFKIVERVYVLKLGKIVFEEKPEMLFQDERLRKAYLA